MTNPTADLIGHRIAGRYLMLSRLGAGSFGITYVAEDLLRPRKPRCVVKQLNLEREFKADEWQATLSFFDQEAEILERLGRHDQIPLLLAHLEEDGNFYIVQDFLEGRTLRDELRAVSRLPETEVITLLHQGLAVLSYVHEQKVIHRDIKPENLIRRQDGVLCLIDFGIVKEFSAQYLSRMAPTTDIAGTQGYAPDEQFRRGKPCPASDIYALGMVSIEALTGKFPTELDTDPNTAELVWQTGLQINPALAEVLTKMVRHHHSCRYANGKEALQALESSLVPPVPTVVVSPKSPEPKLQIQTAIERAVQKVISIKNSGIFSKGQWIETGWIERQFKFHTYFIAKAQSIREFLLKDFDLSISNASFIKLILLTIYWCLKISFAWLLSLFLFNLLMDLGEPVGLVLLFLIYLFFMRKSRGKYLPMSLRWLAILYLFFVAWGLVIEMYWVDNGLLSTFIEAFWVWFYWISLLLIIRISWLSVNLVFRKIRRPYVNIKIKK